MINFLKSIQRKWLYSIIGLWTVLKEEKSILVYIAIMPVIIGLGIWLDLSSVKWSLLIVTIFLVITIEIINTALEAAVDIISFQYNVKVKKIKDIASAATLVMTIGSAISILIILISSIGDKI